MAKNDNLTDFLTNVADAIRYKKNTTERINPQDFFSQIISIGNEGGNGDGAVALPNSVRFFDYDGTLLYSYSTDDFLALTEFPELPTKEGLICQGWNWVIEEAKSFVVKYRKLDIGATYITDDGKTRLYIKIAAEGRMDVPLNFHQDVASGVEIDWGDGSATETISSAGNVNITHKYADIGEYVISLNPVSGCSIKIGGNVSTRFLLGSAGYCGMLQAVEIGNNVRIYQSAFYACHSLASVTIPQGVTSIGANVFELCYSLRSIVIPESVTSIGQYIFQNCRSLTSIIIPQGVTSIGTDTFKECYSLRSIVIPESVTSIDKDTFYSCYSLRSIVIPESVTSIGANVFGFCYSLRSIVIPESVTSIGANVFRSCFSLASVTIPQGVTSIETGTFQDCGSLASIVIPQSITSIVGRAFYSCSWMAFFDFSTHTSVPTLSGTQTFTNIPSDCKIIVPDTLYDEWIVAENWSTYASYIIKKSEWDA